METQRVVEDRLLGVQGLSAVASDSLFSFDRDAALEEAYAGRAEKVGFRRGESQTPIGRLAFPGKA